MHASGHCVGRWVLAEVAAQVRGIRMRPPMRCGYGGDWPDIGTIRNCRNRTFCHHRSLRGREEFTLVLDTNGTVVGIWSSLSSPFTFFTVLETLNGLHVIIADKFRRNILFTSSGYFKLHLKEGFPWFIGRTWLSSIIPEDGERLAYICIGRFNSTEEWQYVVVHWCHYGSYYIKYLHSALEQGPTATTKEY